MTASSPRRNFVDCRANQIGIPTLMVTIVPMAKYSTTHGRADLARGNISQVNFGALMKYN